jgi:hypothetical protein
LLLQGDGYYVPDPLAVFRVSTGSWSVAIGKRQTADYTQFLSKVAQTPGYGARRSDLLAGNIMARLNTYLRMIVYRLVLRRGRSA